jgi:hypothetical protein
MRYIGIAGSSGATKLRPSIEIGAVTSTWPCGTERSELRITAVSIEGRTGRAKPNMILPGKLTASKAGGL